MTAAAFDTLKLAEHLHGAGFTKKQASGLAEGLAEALADHPRRDAVIEAVQEAARGTGQLVTAAERRTGERVEALRSEHGAKFEAVVRDAYRFALPAQEPPPPWPIKQFVDQDFGAVDAFDKKRHAGLMLACDVFKVPLVAFGHVAG